MTIKEAESIIGEKIHYYFDNGNQLMAIGATPEMIVELEKEIGDFSGIAPVVFVIDKQTKKLKKKHIELYNRNGFLVRKLDLSIDKDFMSCFLPVEPASGEDNFYIALKKAFDFRKHRKD